MSVYRNMTISELNQLRSKKYLRITALERKSFLSYSDLVEVRRLNEQVRKIDVELACKRAQTSWFD